MIRISEKARKILVDEGKLLGINSIRRSIGVKVAPPGAVCYLRGTRIRTPEGEPESKSSKSVIQ